MRYREPLTAEQLQNARQLLRQYRSYKNRIERQFPPRTSAEAAMWREALKAVRLFKAEVVARDAEGMNRAAKFADTALTDYVAARWPGAS